MLFTTAVNLRRSCVPICSGCRSTHKPTSPPRGPHAKPSINCITPCLTLGGIALIAAQPAAAIDLLREEPANALSLPTWAIHVSSVVEWVAAMVWCCCVSKSADVPSLTVAAWQGLIWRYGEVSGNQLWKGLTWAMLPSLGGAMCACTWHFFYNSPDLEVRHCKTHTALTTRIPYSFW